MQVEPKNIASGNYQNKKVHQVKSQNTISGSYQKFGAFGSGWNLTNSDQSEGFKMTILHIYEVLDAINSSDSFWGNKGIEISKFICNGIKVNFKENLKINSRYEFASFLKKNGYNTD